MKPWTCPNCGLKTRGFGIYSHQHSRKCWSEAQLKAEAEARAARQAAFEAQEQEREHQARVRRNLAMREAQSKALRLAALLSHSLLDGLAWCLTSTGKVGVRVKGGRVFFGQFGVKSGRPAMPCAGCLVFHEIDRKNSC